MPEVCPVALQQTGGDIRGAIARGARTRREVVSRAPQLGEQSLGTEAVLHQQQKTGQTTSRAQDWPAAVINSSQAR